MAQALEHISDIHRTKSDKSQGALISDLTLAYGIFEAILTFCVGVSTSFCYSFFFLGWSQTWSDVLISAWIVSAAMVGASILRGHYNSYTSRSQALAIWTGLTASLRAFALLTAILFLCKISDNLSRGSIVCQFLAVTCATMLSRAVFFHWVRRGIAAGTIITGRILILGDSLRIVTMITERGLCDNLRREGKDVVRISAWKAFGSDAADESFISGAIDQCRTNAIDSVVLIPTAERAMLTERLAFALSETPVTLHILPFAGLVSPTPGATSIGGQASFAVTNSPFSQLGKMAKRATDIVVSAAMLCSLAPLLLCVAVAIKAESAGPVFFRQNRHGYGNRQFRVFKFRSMRVMEDGRAFRQATRNDPRVTLVGRFIRRTNLDELPQLLNVLLGDMSLVGPRPHPIALNEDFAARIDRFHRRHNILPGITGWAQINGFRGETDTDEKMRGRIEHDLWYVDNWSIGLDLRILVLTLFSSVAYQNAG